MILVPDAHNLKFWVCPKFALSRVHSRAHAWRIVFLGGAAATWPLAAHAQQPTKVPLIGVLSNRAAEDPEMQARLDAFGQGLQQSGWTINQNIRLEYRSGGDNTDQLRRYAAELVALAPDVIVVDGTIEGNVSARSIRVGATGIIKGNVTSEDADVHGSLSEKVEVTEFHTPVAVPAP